MKDIATQLKNAYSTSKIYVQIGHQRAELTHAHKEADGSLTFYATRKPANTLSYRRPKFAWLPVVTLNNGLVWLKPVIADTKWSYLSNSNYTEYFDMTVPEMSNDEARKIFESGWQEAKIKCPRNGQ